MYYNIFGHYFDINAKNNEENKDISSQNKIIKNVCETLLFNGNFDELNKLLRYCLTQNITNIESYKRCNKLYVIVSFISNELAYVVYHDLTIDSMNSDNSNNNSSNNKNSLLFPKLILLKMFKLIYSLLCYICCHPHYRNQEYIYVKQYFNLRNRLYSNKFGNNSEENKQISHLDLASKLNYHNYFCCPRADALLHGVCYLGYHEYCKILIKDGSDMKQRK